MSMRWKGQDKTRQEWSSEWRSLLYRVSHLFNMLANTVVVVAIWMKMHSLYRAAKQADMKANLAALPLRDGECSQIETCVRSEKSMENMYFA